MGWVLVWLRSSEAKPPPMVGASERTMALCPTDRIVAARATWGAAPEKVVRSAFDRAVAEWAVCAHLKSSDGWLVPSLEDPAARGLLAAVRSEPFSSERRSAVLAVAPAFPEAAALLVTEELSGFGQLARLPEDQRVEAFVAMYGGWAPHSTCEGTNCFGEVAVALWQLCRPAFDRENPTSYALRDWVDAHWNLVRAVDLAPAEDPGVNLASYQAAAGASVRATWRWWLTPTDAPILHRRAPALHPSLGVVGYEGVTPGPLVVGTNETQDLWVSSDVPMGVAGRFAESEHLWRSDWVVAGTTGPRAIAIELVDRPGGALEVSGAMPWGMVVSQIEGMEKKPGPVRIFVEPEVPASGP